MVNKLRLLSHLEEEFRKKSLPTVVTMNSKIYNLTRTRDSNNGYQNDGQYKKTHAVKTYYHQSTDR